MLNFDMAELCGSCGQPIEKDEGQPVENGNSCPECNSSPRTISFAVEETVTVREKLHLHWREAGKRKPVCEQTHGDDYQRKTGKWVKLSRVIDRGNNLYHKTVTDPETGEVVHECKEPLSEHRGHGAAKRKDTQ